MNGRVVKGSGFALFIAMTIYGSYVGDDWSTPHVIGLFVFCGIAAGWAEVNRRYEKSAEAEVADRAA